MLGFSTVGELPVADDGSSLGGVDVNLSLPAAALGLQAAIAALAVGKNVDLIAASAGVVTTVFDVLAGKRLDLAPTILESTPPALFVGISAHARLPAISTALQATSVVILPGTLLNLTSNRSVVTNIGAVAEGTIGEFAPGEGITIEYAVQSAPFAILQAVNVTIMPGKNLDLSSADISLSASVPEIAARRRKLKVQSILS